MAMNIIFYSSRIWEIPDIQIDANQDELIRLVGGIKDMVRQIIVRKPDLVFFGAFDPAEPHYLQEVENLSVAMPQVIIVALYPKPEPEIILGLVRAGVREVIDNSTARTLQHIIDRTHLRLQKTGQIARKGRVFGFISSKGGDGSSCLAANLAFALSQEPETRVLAIDIALPFGDLDMYLTGENFMHDLADISSQNNRIDKKLFDSIVPHLSSTLDLVPLPHALEKITSIEAENVTQLMNISASFYDYILVDIGSGFDQVGIGVLEHLEKICVVSTPSLPSLRRAGQLLNFLQEFDTPIPNIELILNCVEPSLPVSLAKIEQLIGRKIEKRIPKDTQAVQQSLLLGQSVLEVAPYSKLSTTIDDWAAQLTGSTHKKRSLWQRLKIK
ncbi:AAA family ATPase [Prosthecochloris sp. CIB 2401]|uniref:AAA family ATPase n=1 Tax=Prosthecochloris sp. CIB 2401 TaxID=1868325 RepID=UPI00080AA4A5|nr:AAA family ATPase [Prosthecochloris sp. CIB 2401]ANT64670.1 Cell division inhibitor MinD [Prosthecochloris sp. CIB 2401]